MRHDDLHCIRSDCIPRGVAGVSLDILHRKLKQVDHHYMEATYAMAYNPIRVISLAKGAFERYYQEKQKNGHDPDTIKLPQMNLPEAAATELLQQEI